LINRPFKIIRPFVAGALAVVSTLIVISCSGNGGNPSQSEVAAQANDSVVRVETTTRRGDIVGSGFVVAGPEGVVVTAYHVVQGARSIRVLLGGAASTSSNIAELWVFDEALDLALLRVPPLGDGIELSSSTLKAGAQVLAMGYPFGLEGDVSVTQGIISRQVEFGGNFYVEHDAEILPGSSGGPLLGEDGKVVGVNIAGIIDVETVTGLNLAVHVKELEKLMKSAGAIRGASIALPSPTPTPNSTPMATP